MVVDTNKAGQGVETTVHLEAGRKYLIQFFIDKNAIKSSVEVGLFDSDNYDYDIPVSPYAGMVLDDAKPGEYHFNLGAELTQDYKLLFKAKSDVDQGSFILDNINLIDITDVEYKAIAENSPEIPIFVPDVLSYNDYYPFGMLVPNRHESSDKYRYGFQGQEKDDEVKGEGNSINYKFRMHDPRVGRFFAVDPLTAKYPWYTPYSFSGNKLIHAIELEGLEEFEFNDGVFAGKVGDSKLKRRLNVDSVSDDSNMLIKKISVINELKSSAAGATDAGRNVYNTLYNELMDKSSSIISLKKGTELKITNKTLIGASPPIKSNNIPIGYQYSNLIIELPKSLQLGTYDRSVETGYSLSTSGGIGGDATVFKKMTYKTSLLIDLEGTSLVEIFNNLSFKEFSAGSALFGGDITLKDGSSHRVFVSSTGKGTGLGYGLDGSEGNNLQMQTKPISRIDSIDTLEKDKILQQIQIMNSLRE